MGTVSRVGARKAYKRARKYYLTKMSEGKDEEKVVAGSNPASGEKDAGTTFRYIDLEDLRLKGKDVNIEKSKVYCSQFRKFVFHFEDEWFDSVTKIGKIMMYFDFTVGMTNDYSAVIQPKEEGAFKPVRVPLLKTFGNYLVVPREKELKKRAREAAWRIFLNEGEPFAEEKELDKWELKKYRRIIDPSKKVSLEKLLQDQEGRARDITQKALKGLPPMALEIKDDINHFSTSFTIEIIAPIHGSAKFDFIDRNGNKLLILTDAEIHKRAREAFEEIFYSQEKEVLKKEKENQEAGTKSNE